MLVRISPAASQHIRRLSPDAATRVTTALRRLQENPRPPGCRLLRDRTPPTWRIRVGDWRIFYEIDDHAAQVRVTGVRHRREAY